MVDFLSNQEIIAAARKNLEQGPWDYLVGASESETTMRRNRLGFDKIAFRPRVCVDVSSIDTSSTFLGHKLRIPVMLAPIGSLQEFTSGAGADATRAASEFGTMHVVSSVTEPSLEDISKAGEFPKTFQLYVHGDWEWCKDILTRVKEAGYAALCVTVDTAHLSRRERPMLGRYLPPTQRGRPDRKYRASVTWDLCERIRDFTGLPFMLKGIATAEDASIAVQKGIDVVWVSNHGGRQLDHGRGAIEVLPEIYAVTRGKAKIILDGGVQRGSDVLKALALGADAVAIGKLQGWGLAAGGSPGLVRVLEILEDEIDVAMGLLGITALDQLTPAFVSPADPVMLPHEMSLFSNIVEGQIR
ncbi:MAG: alpha-hydroxy acid oxidase [Chloroflexota bacterium]